MFLYTVLGRMRYVNIYCYFYLLKCLKIIPQFQSIYETQKFVSYMNIDFIRYHVIEYQLLQQRNILVSS